MSVDTLAWAVPIAILGVAVVLSVLCYHCCCRRTPSEKSLNKMGQKPSRHRSGSISSRSSHGSHNNYPTKHKHSKVTKSFMSWLTLKESVFHSTTSAPHGMTHGHVVFNTAKAPSQKHLSTFSDTESYISGLSTLRPKKSILKSTPITDNTPVSTDVSDVESAITFPAMCNGEKTMNNYNNNNSPVYSPVDLSLLTPLRSPHFFPGHVSLGTPVDAALSSGPQPLDAGTLRNVNNVIAKTSYCAVVKESSRISGYSNTDRSIVVDREIPGGNCGYSTLGQNKPSSSHRKRSSSGRERHRSHSLTSGEARRRRGGSEQGHHRRNHHTSAQATSGYSTLPSAKESRRRQTGGGQTVKGNQGRQTDFGHVNKSMVHDPDDASMQSDSTLVSGSSKPYSTTSENKSARPMRLELGDYYKPENPRFAPAPEERRDNKERVPSSSGYSSNSASSPKYTQV